MKKITTLSGMRPTGELHLGNYLGALRNFTKLQSEYEGYFMIADLHSITEDFEPNKKNEQVLSLATAYLAAGLDPNKCTIFVQSFVPEHIELSWIFASITPVGEMERMTQYKDLSQKHGERVSAGLFCYPLLMAADILLYKPKVVPVGDDQKQHIELTNTIVKKFNRKFGDTFDSPKFLPTKTSRIMSLGNPDKKMSKSEPNTCVFLLDEPETIEQKFKKALTATSGGTENKGVKNLFSIMKEFSDEQTVKQFEMAEKNGSIRYSDFKAQIAHDVSEGLAEFRSNYKKLQKQPKKVFEIIVEGSKQARIVAAKTLGEVKEKIGLPLPPPSLQ
jgi:tryptophanyl-tRNA synthetase